MPMIVTVLVLGASTLALQAAKQTRRPLAELRTTEQRLVRIEQALKAYGVIQARLPCPARGDAVSIDADFGLADPNNANPTCTSPDGVVPWRTLGIPQSEAMDGWGRFISYRVPVDAVGPPSSAGMTGVNAADMTSCNTALPPPPVPIPALTCPPSHDVSVEEYMAARLGFTVTVDGANRTQIGWVLVSHGPSGLGAWLPEGRRMPLPVIGDERTNTSATLVYVQRIPEVLAANGQPLNPSGDANHFDDVVRFQRIEEFITSTARGARDWSGASPSPPPPVAANAPSITLDSDNLATSGVTFSGFSSGEQTLTIPASGTAPALTVSVQAGQQIALDNTGSPKTGIGVCNDSGPCNPTNAELSGAETLSFKLVNATAYKLGVLFKNFTLAESAQITFKLNGAQVGAVVAYSGAGGANATNLVPTVGSAVFDEVVIGAGAASSFFIDTVRFCDASTHCAP
ncbi:MAG: hypothetical protein Q8K34_06270 [Hydrogenophaga sp.]|nr:hypothetical protein [Hydrogenophaga sp.]